MAEACKPKVIEPVPKNKAQTKQLPYEEFEDFYAFGNELVRKEVAILFYGIEDGKFVLRCVDYVKGEGPSHRLPHLIARIISEDGHAREYDIGDPRRVYDAPGLIPTKFTGIFPVFGYGNTIEIYEGDELLSRQAIPDRRTCSGEPHKDTPLYRR